MATRVAARTYASNKGFQNTGPLSPVQPMIRTQFAKAKSKSNSTEEYDEGTTVAMDGPGGPSDWHTRKVGSNTSVDRSAQVKKVNSLSMAPEEITKIKQRTSRRAKTYSRVFVDGPLEELQLVPGSTREKIGNVVDHDLFSWVIATAILFNLAMVIHETNLRAQDEELPQWAKVVLVTIPLLFVVEAITRIYVHRWQYFRQRWNIIDLTVIFSDVCLIIVESIVRVPSISVLRLFRLARLVRAVKVLSRIRELQLMLNSFIAAMTAIFWATFLLAAILLMWGIVAVDVLHPVVRDIDFDGCDRCTRSFESVWSSMLTFLQQIIAGDSWGQITIPTVEHSPWTLSVFVPVFVTVNFGILNLVISVIVSRSLEARDAMQKKHEYDEYQTARASLEKVFTELDADESGTISVEEIIHGIHTSTRFQKLLKEMNISGEEVESMFDILDGDSSGNVDFYEFIDGLYKMKTESAHALLLFIRQYTLDVRFLLQEHFGEGSEPLRYRIERLDERLRKVTRLVQVQEGPESPKNFRKPSIRTSKGADGRTVFVEEPPDGESSQNPLMAQLDSGTSSKPMSLPSSAMVYTTTEDVEEELQLFPAKADMLRALSVAGPQPYVGGSEVAGYGNGLQDGLLTELQQVRTRIAVEVSTALEEIARKLEEPCSLRGGSASSTGGAVAVNMGGGGNGFRGCSLTGRGASGRPLRPLVRQRRSPCSSRTGPGSVAGSVAGESAAPSAGAESPGTPSSTLPVGLGPPPDSGKDSPVAEELREVHRRIDAAIVAAIANISQKVATMQHQAALAQAKEEEEAAKEASRPLQPDDPGS